MSPPAGFLQPNDGLGWHRLGRSRTCRLRSASAAPVGLRRERRSGGAGTDADLEDDHPRNHHGNPCCGRALRLHPERLHGRSRRHARLRRGRVPHRQGGAESRRTRRRHRARRAGSERLLHPEPGQGDEDATRSRTTRRSRRSAARSAATGSPASSARSSRRSWRAGRRTPLPTAASTRCTGSRSRTAGRRDRRAVRAVAPSYIRKMPNFVSGIGAFSAAEIPSASTRRVSSGSMIPSSHRRAVE